MFTLLEHMGDDRTLLQMQRLPNTTPVDLVYRTDRVASRFAQPMLHDARYLIMEDSDKIYHMLSDELGANRGTANHIMLRLYFSINIEDWGALYEDILASCASLFYTQTPTYVHGVLTAGLFDLFVMHTRVEAVKHILAELCYTVAPCTWNVLKQLHNKEQSNG